MTTTSEQSANFAPDAESVTSSQLALTRVIANAIGTARVNATAAPAAARCEEHLAPPKADLLAAVDRLIAKRDGHQLAVPAASSGLLAAVDRLIVSRRLDEASAPEPEQARSPTAGYPRSGLNDAVDRLIANRTTARGGVT